MTADPSQIVETTPPLREPRSRRRRVAALFWRALGRNWGRDVMLYTGGVSFYALLAVFPALSILISLYAVLSTTEDAAALATAFAELMPAGAETLLRGEIERPVPDTAGALSL